MTPNAQCPPLPYLPHFGPDLTGAEGIQGPLKSAQLPVLVNKKLELLSSITGLRVTYLDPPYTHFPSLPTSATLALPSWGL